MKKQLLACLMCLLAIVSPLQGTAQNTVGGVQSLSDGILAYKLQNSGADSVQAFIDGELASAAGVSAEWYILALSQSGTYDFSAYREKLTEYLAATTVRSASSRLKYALTLLFIGAQDAYIAAAMEDAIGQQGVMSWIYGLHLLNNGCQSAAVTADWTVDTLLSLRLTDGGWALSGAASDVDITAMALQALAPYYGKHSAVTVAIDEALDLLSARQLQDGDFSSYGVPNPESTAQVLTALSCLGIDGLSDERFIKNGCTLLDGLQKYRLADGSISHTLGGPSNHTATVQTLCALIAYQRLLAGKPSLYLMDHAAQPTQAQTAPAKAIAIGYKPVAAVIIAFIAVLSCLALFLFNKRHKKNFLFVLLAACALIGFVYATDFESAAQYYNAQPMQKENPIGTVTLSIRCDTVAGKTASAYIPQDGVILHNASFAIAQGDTAYTILTEAVRTHSIQMESAGAQGMVYIAGINYLYEYDFGALSGWMYFVNGQSPSVGCDQYTLSDGDVIEWRYSCELGDDLK